MLRNYLLLSFKNLVRNRLYTLINVLGLSVGLSSCLIIALYVQNELTYDTHYANAQRIYRVDRLFLERTGDVTSNATTAALVGPLLRQNFSGIEAVTRISQSPNQVLLSNGELRVNELGVWAADENVFDFFEVEWISGSPATALTDQYSILLTRTLAEKYFGDVNPFGMTLILNNQTPLRVTGVIEDMPENTHLQFSALIPFSLNIMNLQAQNRDPESWRSMFSWTYILADPGANIEDIQQGLEGFAESNIPEERRANGDIGFSAMALTDIHMQSAQGINRYTAGSMIQVLSFSAVALCILMIAVINFVNLSTVISSRRAMEIGMRKAIGADRRQIITQFLLDTLMMAMLSMLLALALVELFLPSINTVINKTLDLDNLLDLESVILLTGFTVALGILAGSYPAFYLSSFNPVTVLRGELTRGRTGVTLRNILVILQFAAAITLIVVTVVIAAQMQFSREMQLGFNEEQVVEVYLPRPTEFDLEQHWQTLRTELLAGPGINRVTHGISSPLRNFNSMSGFITQHGASEPVSIGYMSIDTDFFDVYEIPLLAGRLLSPGRAEDTVARFDPERPDALLGNVILNEMVASQLGWSPAEAVGKEIRQQGNGANGVFRVAGVVANTVETAKREASPIMYYDNEGEAIGTFSSSVSIRLSGSNVSAALEHIDSVWDQILPDEIINRRFVNDQIEALYQSERKQWELLRWFSIVAIAIACVGLFGLATQNAENRTKEIGVRKVMGSSVWQIIVLLTNDFSKLVLTSNLMAWPVAYFAMNRWLENFAYRIDLTPLIFIGSGLIALCIAWVTVGGTAAKAASQKPVLALRYE